jgi:hypothetical protein
MAPNNGISSEEHHDHYIYIYIYIYICMYVCMYVCTYVRTYVCIHGCMYTWVYVCVCPSRTMTTSSLSRSAASRDSQQRLGVVLPDAKTAERLSTWTCDSNMMIRDMSEGLWAAGQPGLASEATAHPTASRAGKTSRPSHRPSHTHTCLIEAVNH